MEDKRQSSKQKEAADEPLAASYGLLYITRAYNRKEITFEEWLKLSKEWAERILCQHAKAT